MRRVFAVMVLLGHVLATQAVAGIADTPLPVLEAGKTTLHLYSVPGVMGSSCFGTYFFCTSVDTTTMRVGVHNRSYAPQVGCTPGLQSARV